MFSQNSNEKLHFTFRLQHMRLPKVHNFGDNSDTHTTHIIIENLKEH